MGQDLLYCLIVRFSIGISRLKAEYFGGFELALHSARDRAHLVYIPKGCPAQVMRTATSQVTTSI